MPSKNRGKSEEKEQKIVAAFGKVSYSVLQGLWVMVEG